MNEIKYKLRTDTPKRFIFLHSSVDYDFSDYQSKQAVLDALKTHEFSYLINDNHSYEVCEYSREEAQKICDRAEGWFVCLSEYVEESNL